MSDIEELEAQKSDLKKQVELKDQIIRLNKNRDFQAVIDNGFLNDEAARNARIAGDPNIDAKQQHDAMEMAKASGHLQRYLSANVQMGIRAEDTIRQIDEALEELRAEG